MVVTFDFDNTIAMSHIEFHDDEPHFIFESYNDIIISKIKLHIQEGDEVYIVTARDKAKEGLFPTDNIPYHLKKIGLDDYFLPDRVFYTNDQPKMRILRKLGSQMHWDDKMEELIELKRAGMNAKNPYDLLEDSLKVAKALIFDKNDRILVLERGDGDNLWDIPGGHLKKIEENRGWAGTKEGLEREVAEETGLFLPNEKFIGTFNLFWKEEVHEITVFATKLSTSEPEVDLNLQNYQENLSYEWVSYEELLKMLPNSVKTLKYAVEFLPKDKLISMEEGNQLSWAKKHRKMKTKLIGMGKNKHTGGGKGHKRPNMSRSKSAPAGFGVLEEEDDEKPAKIKVKIAKKTRKAAIIKGNPAHLAKNKQISDKFYKEIADILKNEGFDVDFHESKAFSWPGKPKKMVYDLWIGHSLGSDRLEGAVEGGYTRKVIGFGVPNPEKQPFLAINHPKDDPKPGKIGGIEHYLLSNEMKKALKNTINRPKKPNFTYMGHHPAEDWDSKWHDSSKNKRGDK